MATMASMKIEKQALIDRLRKRFGARPHTPRESRTVYSAAAHGDVASPSVSRTHTPSQTLPLARSRAHHTTSLAGADAKLTAGLPVIDGGLLTLDAVNEYCTANSLLMNKVEIENLFQHFGVIGAKGDPVVDMSLFLGLLCVDDAGSDPVWYHHLPATGPTEAHLALSGTPHLEFGEQYKPFPKHWGIPPNAQMKGHDGIVRDLPNGYGKGNAPMEKWVVNNMAADSKTSTTVRGVKPYPYGNYSL